MIQLRTVHGPTISPSASAVAAEALATPATDQQWRQTYSAQPA